MRHGQPPGAVIWALAVMTWAAMLALAFALARLRRRRRAPIRTAAPQPQPSSGPVPYDSGPVTFGRED